MMTEEIKMSEEIKLTEKIKQQILAIRDSGVCNMLSIHEVQREAFNRNFYELVMFIEENRKGYVHFIFYGEREGA